MMRGADVLLQGLVDHGTDTIFALSGNQIMPVFDAILDHDIRLIHTRHEAPAVFMAEAYAQITGKLGVALVTAGGGLGNTAGALIAAQASDTPVLLLSGDSPVAQDGRGAFQEMDQTGLTRGLTKGSRRVLHVDDMAEALAWAIDLAQRGRPGPVHLALPADVLTDHTQVAVAKPRPNEGGAPQLPDMTAFGAAQRPLVILGPSLNDTRAPDLARALQDRLGAPVVAAESPRGLNDPALGRIADVARRADHVLCLGKPVDFTLNFADPEHWPNVASWDVVLGNADQMDTARRNLGARLASGIVGDPRALAQHLATHAAPQPARTDWIDDVTTCIAARVPVVADEDEDEDEDGAILPTDICAIVQRMLDRSEPATVICDGGEFGQWTQAGVSAAKRIFNGVSGVIGGTVAYAIGARAAAAPEATVVTLMGDGGFGFHLSEFETAVRAGLPFIAVIGNDQRWNAEHLIQTRAFGAERQIGCDLSGARYDLAVAALGGFGAYVTQKDQLQDALERALQSGLPACVNVRMHGVPAPTL